MNLFYEGRSIGTGYGENYPVFTKVLMHGLRMQRKDAMINVIHYQNSKNEYYLQDKYMLFINGRSTLQ